MRPADLPSGTAEAARRLHNVRLALAVLRYAAVSPVILTEDDAVKRAAYLLRAHRPPTPTPPRVWVKRLETPGAEWLELPGVQAVRWAK